MIFPIGDENVKGGHKPIFSYFFLVLNILFFVYQLADPELRTCTVGAIPKNILNGEEWMTLFTSMFAHGGFSHILGNMLFLWIFADNIEAVIGNIQFALFYILGGLAAHFGHIYFGIGGSTAIDCCDICVQGIVNTCDSGNNLCMGSIPTVGASGAIAAVMGAYLVMFPTSKIKTLFLIFFRVDLYAFIYLGVWISIQFFNGMGQAGAGIAWWAHIGGFIFGALVVLFLRTQRHKSGNTSLGFKYPFYL